MSEIKKSLEKLDDNRLASAADGRYARAGDYLCQ